MSTHVTLNKLLLKTTITTGFPETDTSVMARTALALEISINACYTKMAMDKAAQTVSSNSLFKLDESSVQQPEVHRPQQMAIQP